MAKATKQITYRPDVDPTKKIIKVPGYGDQVQQGSSGVLEPEPGEARVQCPKCGSPALAQFNGDSTKYANELPDFTCEAGDCGYVGHAVRRGR